MRIKYLSALISHLMTKQKTGADNMIVRIVVPCQCSIKIMLLAPSNEQTKRFWNFLHFQDLLGQLVPCRSDALLNRVNMRGRHMLVRLETSRCLSQIASIWSPTGWVLQRQIHGL